MTRQLTLRQLRKARDATEVPEFTPSTHVETLPERMNRGTFTKIGWIAPSHLSDEAWLETGFAIRDNERATPWLYGDWYSARTDLAAEHLLEGWEGPPSIHTLQNYASVAKAFPHSRRRELLSFKHHAELVGLSEIEQDELLEWCAGPRRPSVAELRKEKQRRSPPVVPLPKDIALRVVTFFPEALHAWATDAAADDGMSLAAWIIDLVEQEKGRRS